jgi:hypothetical protein
MMKASRPPMMCTKASGKIVANPTRGRPWKF